MAQEIAEFLMILLDLGETRCKFVRLGEQAFNLLDRCALVVKANRQPAVELATNGPAGVVGQRLRDPLLCLKKVLPLERMLSEVVVRIVVLLTQFYRLLQVGNGSGAGIGYHSTHSP